MVFVSVDVHGFCTILVRVYYIYNVVYCWFLINLSLTVNSLFTNPNVHLIMLTNTDLGFFLLAL